MYVCLSAVVEDVGRVKDFVELHDQVEVRQHSLDMTTIPPLLNVYCHQTGVNLLDSLETFLSTFQKDLSAVSGQISELQDRSKDIENRLKSRRVCSLLNRALFNY